MIVENRANPDLLRRIISNMSEETLDRARSVLNNQSTINYEDFAPVLNILLYANVGVYDFDASRTDLSNLLMELNPPQDVYENNLGETGSNIDANIRNENNENEERQENYNSAQTNILSSINWQAVLRRGGMMLAMGAASYFGAPYLGSLSSLGIRMLENSPELSSFSNGTGTTARAPSSRVTWNDVSGSFWGSWSLFARYMGRRSD